jgi:hypothetical protein
LLRCQTISALGARWGSALKVPTHTHRMRGPWFTTGAPRAEIPRNYCPQCHKNTRPLTAEGPLVPVRVFSPCRAGFPTGEFERSPSPLTGKWRESSPPFNFNGCRITHFIRSPARASHSLLVQEGQGLAAIRLSPGMNRRPVVTSCASGIRAEGSGASYTGQ